MPCIYTKKDLFSIMRHPFLVLFGITHTYPKVSTFVVPYIDVNDNTFKQLSYGDTRTGSRAVADALREYMTQNQIYILLEQGKFFLL